MVSSPKLCNPLAASRNVLKAWHNACRFFDLGLDVMERLIVAPPSFHAGGLERRHEIIESVLNVPRQHPL